MHKILKKLFVSLVSICFICLSLSFFTLNVFAADGNSGKGISKGLTAFIMISIFLVTAVIAGLISFKCKVKKIHNKEDSSDK
ncbi:hypothetical protein [Ruminococcus sp.]|uniref:hypothetical protein n=1 Tax=Ruminococcus sp. TaxID=41978 RepID=UPI0025F4EB2C|nr:hypothetical protein [Ruminococcus sp.]